jgi:hypothetical protein
MTFQGILREFQGIERIGSPMSWGKFVCFPEFRGILKYVF